MSSLFDLNERVRRLRETFLYFKNAALLTGAEIRDAPHARDDERAQMEWASLVKEVRGCLEAAEAVMAADKASSPAELPRMSAKALNDCAEASDLAATRH